MLPYHSFRATEPEAPRNKDTAEYTEISVRSYSFVKKVLLCRANSLPSRVELLRSLVLRVWLKIGSLHPLQPY